MTWALDSSNTRTIAALNTEYTLATSVNNGTFVFEPRLNNVGVGDVFEFRIYTICLTGGVLELAWKAAFGPIKPIILKPQSLPVVSDQSIKVTVKQLAGTPRSFDWKLLRW